MKSRFDSHNALILEDVKGSEIMFRHMSGKVDARNKYGEISFCVEIDEDLADNLIAAGWKVKLGKEKEDGSHYKPKLKVDLYFESDYWRPEIKCYSSKGCEDLTKETVINIEHDQIESAYLRILPRRSRTENNGDGLIHGKLKNMRYKLEEDPFDGVFESDNMNEDDDIPFA